MNRSTALTFALLLGAGLPAAAQSTTPTGAPASPAAARQDAVQEVKISGCLRSSSAGSTGSERQPVTATQPVVFTIDVQPAHAPSTAPQSDARAAAEAGSAGTGGHGLTPATYTVAPSATAKVDLAKHVNHQVELTGVMRDAAGPSTAARAQTTPSREMPEATDPSTAATMRTFEVTGVREIAASCPAK